MVHEWINDDKDNKDIEEVGSNTSGDMFGVWVQGNDNDNDNNDIANIGERLGNAVEAQAGECFLGQWGIPWIGILMSSTSTPLILTSILSCNLSSSTPC